MVFILHQELSLYEFYQQQIGAIDAEIEQCLAKFRLFSTLCDNQCLSFVEFLLGRALKTIFLENYPYSSSFHTETRRAKFPSVTEEPPPPSVKKNCRRKTHPPSYQELGADYYEQQYCQRVINNLSKKAQSLGFQLVEASST